MTQNTGKTNYEIRENREFASREVTFEGKPSAAVRTALKALKMRWHATKKMLVRLRFRARDYRRHPGRVG